MCSVGKDDREMAGPGNALKALINEIIHMLLSTGQDSGSPSVVHVSLRVPETLSGVSRSKLFYNAKCYLPSSFSFSRERTVELPKGWTLCGTGSGSI